MRTDSVAGLRAAQRRIAEVFSPPPRPPLPANVQVAETEARRIEELASREARRKQWDADQAAVRSQQRDDLRLWRSFASRLDDRKRNALAARDAALAAHDADAALAAQLEIVALGHLLDECDRTMQRQFGPTWAWPR